MSFRVLFYRPNIDVLTFARTECDPIYAGFRYADMGLLDVALQYKKFTTD